MNPEPWRLDKLLPHAAPAILLDEIRECDAARLVAAVTIHAASPFHGAGGVPAHVGIEYMAQACGAFSGVRALLANETPRVGFILGTRRYTATVKWFPAGAVLLVAVDLVFNDEEVGMFDCRIVNDGVAIASAQLVLAQPRDAMALLGQQSGHRDGGPDA